MPFLRLVPPHSIDSFCRVSIFSPLTLLFDHPRREATGRSARVWSTE